MSPVSRGYDSAMETRKALRFKRFAFPNLENPPAKLRKPFRHSAISPNVSDDFSAPKLATGLWPYRIPTAMVMPKASVHKHDAIVLPENQVGLAWQTRDM